MVQAELWRRGDRRGRHVRLLNPAAADLRSLGLDEDSSGSDSEPEGGVPEPSPDTSSMWTARAIADLQELGWRIPAVPDPSKVCFDFIEVFSGSYGVSSAMHAAGLTVGPPLDISRGYDLVTVTLVLWLLFMCRSGRVRYVWLGPPCTTFSLAQHPGCRCASDPWVSIF